jgi:hypothetical protein
LSGRGIGVEALRSALAVTLGLAERGERVASGELVGRFELARITAAGGGPVRFTDVLAAAEQAR